MNNFLFVVPVYNGENIIEKCLDSIKRQNYIKHIDYDAIVIDDCSTDNTWKLINKYGFKGIRNEEHKGSATANIIKGIKNGSKDKDDIIIIVDGDDYLKDISVLAYLDEIYKEGIWLTYGQYECLSGKFTNVCQPLNEIHTCDSAGIKIVISLETNEYRRNCVWCTSHLKTFKRWLFDKIDDRDLRDEDGEYFKTCCDVCLMFPMIEMAGKKHIKYIDKILYVYNDLTNNYGERAEENICNFEYLKNRPIYQQI